MKKTLALITLLVILVFTGNSQKQNQHIDSILSESLKNIDKSNKFNNSTKMLLDSIKQQAAIANELYKASNKFAQNQSESETRFINRLDIILTIITLMLTLFAAVGIFNSFMLKREAKKSFENAKNDLINQVEVDVKLLKDKMDAKFVNEFNNFKTENEKAIMEIIEKHKDKSDLTGRSKILVLNKSSIKTGNNTDIEFTEDFKKAMNVFKNVTYDQEDSIEDLSETDFSGYDLIVLENANDGTHWDINTWDKKYKTEPTYQQEVDANISQLIALANKICQTSSLVYYGLSGKGQFPSEKIEEKYRHLVAFANSPSALYSNIISMLRFKKALDA